jgi:hypothetical protein
MKRNLIIIVLALFPFFIQAQSSIEEGYYRVSNMKTERYVYVRDNTGSINYSALSAEMGAVELWKDHDKTLSDPGSIIYLKKVENGQYDLKSQGTGILEMIERAVTISAGNGFYQLYAEGKYLCDENRTLWMDDGNLGTNGSGNYTKWIADKVDVATDEWFGITPSIEANGKFYQPFYADFGFTPLSDDIKVWYISVIDTAGVVLKEFTGDVVPARMPVFIECTSSVTSQNKLDLKYYYATLPADNKLKGVYFNKPSRRAISNDACTEFNSSTMRVLGVMEDGRLGYVLSNEPLNKGKQYLAANQSYLVVESHYPSEIPVITEAEYEEILARRENAAVHSTTTASIKEVYSISGRFIGMLTAKQISELHPGLYIIERKKVSVE